MAFGAESGVEDSLGFRRECLKDVIEVLHGGFLLVCVSSHCERCGQVLASTARSRVKVCP